MSEDCVPEKKRPGPTKKTKAEKGMDAFIVLHEAGRPMGHKELIEKIGVRISCKESTAKSRVQNALAAKLILKFGDLYKAPTEG